MRWHCCGLLLLLVFGVALEVADGAKSSSSKGGGVQQQQQSNLKQQSHLGVPFSFYVYELPRQVNKHWSDVAFFSADKTTHEFARGGDWMFFAETFIHDRLMEHPWRTLDPAQADVFFIPVYTAVLMHHAHSDIATTNLKAAYDKITKQFPYFRKSNGQDHVVFFTYDLGACDLPKPLPFLRHLIHVGFGGDPSLTCYSPLRDIVIPPFTASVLRNGSASLTRPDCVHQTPPNREYRYLAHFRGLILPYDSHCPIDRPPVRGQTGPQQDTCYGIHVRNKMLQRLANEPTFLISANKVDFWRHLDEMKESMFCLCPHGRASWTQRLFAAIHAGCVPVVIGATDLTYPFERFIDWSKVIVEVSLEDLPSLKSKLEAISLQQHSAMRAAGLRASCTVLSYSETATSDDAVAAFLAEVRAKREQMPHLDRWQGRPGRTAEYYLNEEEHVMETSTHLFPEQPSPSADTDEAAAVVIINTDDNDDDDNTTKSPSSPLSSDSSVTESTKRSSGGGGGGGGANGAVLTGPTPPFAPVPLGKWRRYVKPKQSEDHKMENMWLAQPGDIGQFLDETFAVDALPTPEGPVPEASQSLDGETLMLLANVRERMSNVDCKTAQLLVYPYYGNTQGFGGNFQSIAFALAVALHMNRVLAEPTSVSWNGAGVDCGNKKIRCFLDPVFVSPCKWKGDPRTLPAVDINSLFRKDGLPRVMRLDVDLPMSLIQRVTAEPPESLAPLRSEWDVEKWRPWEHWWFTALELHLFSPLNAILQPIHTHHQRILAARAGPGVLGMHVRRGDAFRISYRRVPILEEYMTHALHLLETRGVKTIVLATDDPITAEHALEIWQPPFEIVLITTAIRTGDLTGQTPLAQASQTQSWHPKIASRMTREVVQDIFLLSETNYFIGSCHSQTSRLGAELAFAKGLLRAPPVAIDAVECLNFKHAYKVGPWTTNFPPS